MRQVLVVRLFAREFGRDAPALEDDDSVADLKNFVEFGRHDDGAVSLGHEFAEEGVNLLPGKDNPGDGSVSIPVDKETAFTSDGDKRTITIERIILPELLLSGDNNIKEKGLTMTVATDSWSVSGVIAPSVGNYSLPRNTYLATRSKHENRTAGNA